MLGLAIGGGGHDHAMPVNGRRFRQPVGEANARGVTLVRLECRAGEEAVVREHGRELAAAQVSRAWRSGEAVIAGGKGEGNSQWITRDGAPATSPSASGGQRGGYTPHGECSSGYRRCTQESAPRQTTGRGLGRWVFGMPCFFVFVSGDLDASGLVCLLD